MQVSSGAMGHDDWLRLPWPVFCAYVESVAEMSEDTNDIRYFNGSEKLARIWRENKHKWVH